MSAFPDQKCPIRQLQTKKRMTRVNTAGHSVIRRPAPTAPLVVGVMTSTDTKTSKARIVAPHRNRLLEVDSQFVPRMQPKNRVAASKQIVTVAYQSKGVGSPEPSIIIFPVERAKAKCRPCKGNVRSSRPMHRSDHSKYRGVCSCFVIGYCKRYQASHYSQRRVSGSDSEASF